MGSVNGSVSSGRSSLGLGKAADELASALDVEARAPPEPLLGDLGAVTQVAAEVVLTSGPAKGKAKRQT